VTAPADIITTTTVIRTPDTVMCVI
jgi:hypothetical protein